MAEGLVVLSMPGRIKARRWEGALVSGCNQSGKGKAIDVSLATPVRIRELRRKLFLKGKHEPTPEGMRGTRRYSREVKN